MMQKKVSGADNVCKEMRTTCTHSSLPTYDFKLIYAESEPVHMDWSMDSDEESQVVSVVAV